MKPSRVKTYSFFKIKSKRKRMRAKRLYVHHCRQAIALDRSGDVLEYCAVRLISSGLANCSLSDTKYLILRRMWKYDRHKIGWHDWVYKNGWTCRPWKRRQM